MHGHDNYNSCSYFTCVYQVLCEQVPFGTISIFLMITKIAKGIRPQKPDAGESLGFTGELWRMVEHCWRENDGERPNVEEILQCLERAAQTWDTRPPAPDPVEIPDRGYSPA